MKVRFRSMRTTESGASSVLNDESLTGLDASDFATPFIMRLLRALWVDAEFWLKIKSDASAAEITKFIKINYRLIFPDCPVRIWRALVPNRHHRENLFKLIAKQPWRLITPKPHLAERNIIEDLSDITFQGIIGEYLSPSGLDNKTLLAWHCFSKETLAAIKDIADRLSADAKWCLEHYDIIPVTCARIGIGAPKQIERTELLENLIRLVCQHPGASDGVIARQYKPGKTDATIRKAVKAAKKVAELREGVRVKYHPKK